MDHNKAVQMQAVEKYVLGELPPALRDEFEEHYFDCGECALDVKAIATFVDTMREVLRQESQKGAEREGARSGSGWWPRLAVAIPAFAALLLVITYQNLVTLPRAKEEAASRAGLILGSTYSLQMANTRGGEEVKIQVSPNESFALKFDFTPSRSLDNYVCQLQDVSGHTVVEALIPGTSANREAQLVVPAGRVKPGRYALVFTGAPGAKGQEAAAEVLRLGFVLEFPH